MLRRAFNGCRRVTGSRREHGLDELDGLLDLLIAHSLDAPRMFNFHIPRAQQCQQLAVSCRLSLAHLGNCRWTAVPEVSEQGRNKLAIQLLAVTRADRTACSGASIRTSIKHGLVGLVLICKVDGLVLARRQVDITQHLAAARTLAFDMDYKGGALALLAQDGAQAEHRVDVARRDRDA